ncbi:flagellar export protein FliJ [Pseudomonas sp. RIT-To-2]|uniref:flagellar export protein FliJ n=1 Tax=Pseudomonas sp. RIT-To-2 TaxID=3462541 RepID=UPI0024133222
MTSSLDLLAELAHKARDGAARTLAQQRQALRQLAGQLKTLQQYQQEYRQSLQNTLHAEGMSPPSLANYRAFLASLDTAMDRARNSMAKQQAEIDKSKQAWQAEWRKAHAYETLLQRRAAQEQQVANRREQRQSDELGARMRQQPGQFSRT